eukprot:TRINITY_DN2163_c0_g1_i1.p1 TRINITY_DN2163_c0_g1~~TRINITY_DN2163_c0_g1_i1.p1  ORF type:complete len:419 (-),score=45.18 TRINITY_DN2163_c0_g1_i1:26-1282(-)
MHRKDSLMRDGVQPVPRKAGFTAAGVKARKAMKQAIDQHGAAGAQNLRDQRDRDNQPVMGVTGKGGKAANYAFKMPKYEEDAEEVGSLTSRVADMNISNGEAGDKPELVNGKPRFTGADTALIEAIETSMLTTKNTVTWDDVVCHDEAKRVLREVIVLPYLMPDFFTGIRSPAKGVLLYGPPGTGKTLLAKAIASQCKVTFFNCGPSLLTSRYFGQSEKLVRTLFAMARYYAPSVIYMDEVDGLATQRSSGENEATRRIKAEVLQQIDGIPADNSDGRVVVIGSTNRPQDLDEAIRRRFEHRIHIPLPSQHARKELAKHFLKETELDSSVDLDKLACKTHGFSASDIMVLCREAAMAPFRRAIDGFSDEQLQKMAQDGMAMCPTQNDFEESLSRMRPSVGPEDLQPIEAFNKTFGTHN